MKIYQLFLTMALTLASAGGPKAQGATSALPASGQHSFRLGAHDFLLDGKPFRIISGEMHPARIPRPYWRQRIRMAKAMGCNTIAVYIFWNYLETSEGHFDFKTENRDVAAFIKICQAEGMWVLLRPGPYVCAEWDFGGLPTYLLSIPDIKIRCSDPRYLKAVTRYVTALAAQVEPLLVRNGGPILMVQIENEYGSYGNDKTYLEWLRRLWVSLGVTGPFYTADGATDFMLEAGNIDGAAIGLDPGTSEHDFEVAERHNPNVPAFSSETYPGWLTHWGEGWARADTAGILKDLKFLMDSKHSFNLYVAHGGTNFGFHAGANSGGKGYEPDVTSYDYDAPIDEHGAATPKFWAIRRLLAQYEGDLPDLPAPEPVRTIPEFQMETWGSIWNQLPHPLHAVQPKPFEAYGQNQGFMVYKTRLVGHHSGKLVLTDLHDFATVFVNHRYVGPIDRRLGQRSIDLPKPAGDSIPELEILVEGMGHINFAQELIDRKGITERATLDGMTLMNWDIYPLPMDPPNARRTATDGRPGLFFKGTFTLDTVADTYLDLSGYTKGVVWVNGHNLGRYWNIGPQKHLYCPAPWLRKGINDVLVFDNLQIEAKPIKGVTTLE